MHAAWPYENIVKYFVYAPNENVTCQTIVIFDIVSHEFWQEKLIIKWSIQVWMQVIQKAATKSYIIAVTFLPRYASVSCSRSLSR